MKSLQLPILLLLILLFSFGIPHLCAQNRQIDSLLILLKKGNEDTNKVKTLNELARLYIIAGNSKEGISNSQKALELSLQNNFKSGIAQAYNNMGNIYSNQADYSKALDYYRKALKEDEEINDKSGIARRLTNLGNIYYYLGDYPKALDYYFKALKSAEELGNKQMQGNNISNIGSIYFNQKDYPKALNYYSKSLQLNEELDDKSGMITSLSNMGVVYSYLGRKESDFSLKDSLYEMSLSNSFKAFKIAEEIGDKNQICLLLGNIGNSYYDQAHVSHDSSLKAEFSKKALEYNLKALKIAEELEDKIKIVVWLGNIGGIYSDTKKYKEAENILLNALKIAKEIGAKDPERILEESLTELYTQTKQYALALEHYKNAMALKDTLYNESKNEEITRREMNFEFEQKEIAAKAILEKKEAVQQSEAGRQQLITWFAIAVAIAVALFALFIFRALRITQNQKKIITEKNKRITDSINYAKRIQDAILPSKEDFKNCFSDHFIFFQPREIVSGDFYWLSAKDDKIIIAAADCTGHGVPGAFMSMIGNTLLNEIVNEQHITQPSDILNHLNEGIIHALHQESRSQDDGMDITVCLFEKNKNKVTFAGANHSIYIVADNILEKYEGDFYAIGSMFGPKDSFGRKKDFSFSQQEIQLKKDSSIYFFTDGFADQMGGTSGKKFLIKRFKELLLEISTMEIKEQEQKIKKTFEEWKGVHSQLDDMLIIGIKT